MTPAAFCITHFKIILPLGCGIFSALGTWALLPVLRRHVIDIPNQRSSHNIPVPRGGGIAMIAAMLIGLWVAGASPWVVSAALLLCLVSFIDDMRSLPVIARLGVQVLAMIMALSATEGRILPGFIPASIEDILLGIAWLWFINLTNFMDGIDGISAMEAILIACGVCIMHVPCPWIPSPLVIQAGAVAASAYGFYLFNRSPAKLFMGDAGSIPLGFILAYLLIQLARHDQLAAALILPAYYVCDATWTLLKRQMRGEKVWHAHAEHAYQQAVRRGLTHAQVVARISWLNAALILLALGSTVSMMAAIACLVVAYGLTFSLLYRFAHAASS